MKKYLAGGQTVGSAGSCFKEDCSQTNQAFSAMLAARDKQMADLWASPSQQQQTPLTQNQIVVRQPVQKAKNNKEIDINTVLEGDY